MLISVSGKINSGKDTVGKIIRILTSSPHFTNEAVLDFLEKDLYESDWQIKKFANKLKDVVCILLGCTREQLEDKRFKEQELGEEWWYYKGRNGSLIPFNDDSKRSSEDLIKLTPRLLMQLLGTECGRQILHPNVWVNSLMSEYKLKWVPTGDSVAEEDVSIQKEYPNWIITDTRFPNELRAVKDRAGITIRVNRPDFVENSLTGEKFIVKVHKSEHLSETSLDHAEFDYVIENDGTLKDLKEKVIEILKEEKIL